MKRVAVTGIGKGDRRAAIGDGGVSERGEIREAIGEPVRVAGDTIEGCAVARVDEGVGAARAVVPDQIAHQIRRRAGGGEIEHGSLIRRIDRVVDQR